MWILQTDAMENSSDGRELGEGTRMGGGDSVGKMPVKQPEFRLKYICKKGGHGDTGLSF